MERLTLADINANNMICILKLGISLQVGSFRMFFEIMVLEEDEKGRLFNKFVIRKEI